MDEPRLLYSKKSAAKVLDLSVRSVEYLLATGALESRRVGRKVLIPKASLVKFASRDHATVKPTRCIERVCV
jgi:excisionase family DNA binding protein